MARLVEFKKEDLLEKTIDYIRKNGTQNMTARNLCHYIGCSTQPIFKNFGSMGKLKDEVNKYLKNYYENFINGIINKNAYLYTINYSYTLFALEEPNLFEALFMSDLDGVKSIDDVLKSDNDMEVIESIPEQYHLSKKQSVRLYRDVKIYTHGLSCQIACNGIYLKKEDIGILIKNVINNLKKEI